MDHDRQSHVWHYGLMAERWGKFINEAPEVPYLSSTGSRSWTWDAGPDDSSCRYLSFVEGPIPRRSAAGEML